MEGGDAVVDVGAARGDHRDEGDASVERRVGGDGERGAADGVERAPAQRRVDPGQHHGAAVQLLDVGGDGARHPGSQRNGRHGGSDLRRHRFVTSSPVGKMPGCAPEEAATTSSTTWARARAGADGRPRRLRASATWRRLIPWMPTRRHSPLE